VVVSFDLGCSHCPACKRGLYSSCDTTNPSQDQEALYGHRSGGWANQGERTYKDPSMRHWSGQVPAAAACLLHGLPTRQPSQPPPSCAPALNSVHQFTKDCKYLAGAGGFLGYSHMTGGYEGGQAEFLRVPFGR
jgi:threonine dehydrogenase-like Zn-dependent dehydrogenase